MTATMRLGGAVALAILLCGVSACESGTAITTSDGSAGAYGGLPAGGAPSEGGAFAEGGDVTGGGDGTAGAEPPTGGSGAPPVTGGEGGEGGEVQPGSGGAGGEAQPGSGGAGGEAQPGSGGAGGEPPLAGGSGVGELCAADGDCRFGLECTSDECVPAGTTALGGPCVLSAECAGEAQCVGATCVPAGSAGSGDACQVDADCGDGLRCALVGMSLSCTPEGMTDVGGACATPADCFAGLSCVDGACAPSVPGIPVFGVPAFEAADCADPVAEGEPVRALFEVPGVEGGAASDFFALPFPNDVRLVDGHPDLEGFPTPGASLFGFDPLARYVDALEAHAAGWGTNPTVIFRFSGPIDPDTFRGDPFPVHWTDVTAGAPEYGAIAGLSWQYFPTRSNAVCADSFTVRRPAGFPLLPGHTYAVWLSDDGKAADGSDIERSPQFAAMLAPAAPADAALAAAWQRFRPLRDLIASPPAWWAEALPSPVPAPVAARILTATVITVDDVLAPMQALAAAVADAPVPVATDWVRCGDGEPSPCPQAEGERACGSGTAGYDEYHALVSLPIFQQGEPPYLDAGGAIVAEPVSTEPVCLSLTVPTRAMPAAGWPLVIHAHGTGGSFRTHAGDAIAGTLSAAATGAGPVRFAVLGIDQVAHGPRRGSSADSPENLFYNFLNPDAARGNPLQGAADQLSLARFAAALDVDAATSGGEAIRIDPARIVFFGHSQGATEGSLALPFMPAIPAAVLSGNGASIKDALLAKTSPVDIAGIVPYLLGDPVVEGGAVRLAGGASHPGLTLIGQWIDPADPLNFARLLTEDPPEGQAPKHVLQPYGLGDTFSPPATLAIFAVAAGLDEAEPEASVETPDDLGLTLLTVPASGNVVVGEESITALLRQYQPPAGRDGHFVVFDVASANADMARFLGLAASGEAPVVGD